MLKPYLSSPDLCYTGMGVKDFDYSTNHPRGYSLVNKNNNIYDATRNWIEQWVE